MTTGRLVLAGALLAGIAQPGVHAAELRAGPALTVAAGRVSMEVGSQKLVFVEGSQSYSLMTYVRDRGAWREGFDAAQPLLTGSLFGGRPAAFKVLAKTRSRISVEFVGRHAPAEGRIAASAGVAVGRRVRGVGSLLVFVAAGIGADAGRELLAEGDGLPHAM